MYVTSIIKTYLIFMHSSSTDYAGQWLFSNIIILAWWIAMHFSLLKNALNFYVSKLTFFTESSESREMMKLSCINYHGTILHKINFILVLRLFFSGDIMDFNFLHFVFFQVQYIHYWWKHYLETLSRNFCNIVS